MERSAMAPFGRALLDFQKGVVAAPLIVRRDDGLGIPLPAAHFFRPPSEFSPIEVAALERCRGHVLDIGAGSGLHSLALRERGLEVTSIDISPEAVEVMVRRGLAGVHCTDVLNFQGSPFDTLLLLGHGLGMVGDLPGLERFLARAQELTRIGGCLLVNSLDVRRTQEPRHLAYHQANRVAGRYFGMTRIRVEYGGMAGPYHEWLHLDAETLRRQARLQEWDFELIREEQEGEYLACLTRK